MRPWSLRPRNMSWIWDLLQSVLPPFANNQKVGKQEICFLCRQQVFTVWMFRVQKYNGPRRFLPFLFFLPWPRPSSTWVSRGWGCKLKYLLSPLAPILPFNHQSSHFPRTFIQFGLTYNWHSLINHLLPLLVFLLCHLFTTTQTQI